MSERRGSLTARAIAIARGIGAADIHDELVTEVLPASDAMAVRVGRELVELGGFASTAGNLLTGGLTGHAALRMASVDDGVRRAVSRGCRQMVIIGAGFDTRAWRLDELRDVAVVELDLAATQDPKRKRFAGRKGRAEVEFVAVDLARRDLGDVLDATSLDLSQPTAWLWEAVAMYLPPAAVERTLATLASRSADGSHLIMTFLAPDLVGSGRIAKVVGAAVRRSFALLDEPLLTAHDDDELRALLSSHGFSVTRVTGSDDWARDAGVTIARDLFAAERLAEATR